MPGVCFTHTQPVSTGQTALCLQAKRERCSTSEMRQSKPPHTAAKRIKIQTVKLAFRAFFFPPRSLFEFWAAFSKQGEENRAFGLNTLQKKVTEEDFIFFK